VEALSVFEQKEMAALLPDFLMAERMSKAFLRVRLPKSLSVTPGYFLAWNPRLLRLNPHAARRRDWLAIQLSKRMA
jgi:DNA-binding transcriptional LysR family regulator